MIFCGNRKPEAGNRSARPGASPACPSARVSGTPPRRFPVSGFRLPAPRGIALVLVLWLLALLTALVATFAVTARTEQMQARHLRFGIEARYAALAGMELAAARMMEPDPQRRWIPDGREYLTSFAGAELRLRVQDETGKLDINVADDLSLARFFEALGEDSERALRLAGAIVDWRDMDDFVHLHGAEGPEYAAAGLPYGPKNRAFDTLGELQQVLGMDYETFERAAPYLTVFTGRPPDPALAEGPVLAAYGYPGELIEAWLRAREAWSPDSGEPPPTTPAGQPYMVSPGSGTYSIASLATLADGSRAMMHAVVRVGSAAPHGPPYALLHWREGN